MAETEPGGRRDLRARWTLTGVLVLESAAHFRGEEADVADLTVLRDRLSGGQPLLPGTSLGGALRSHLADLLGGYGSAEKPNVAELFGASRRDDRGSQSPIIVFDALGTLPGGHGVEIRDGVAIDAAHGTAEDHKKFDFEVLPAGTRFDLRLDLVVEGDADEAGPVSSMVAALGALTPEGAALGARRSRGLGRLSTHSWRAARHDLTSADGWLGWLASDDERPAGASAARANPVDACRQAWPAAQLADVPDRRSRVVVTAHLKLRSGLLVRSPATSADAPDVAQLVSGGSPVLPGTGLAGALRARARRIAALARGDNANTATFVDKLFGPAPPAKLTASRLRVSESVVSDQHAVRVSRIRIDRATQGVMTGALFDEEPLADGILEVRLELRRPEAGEIGLLLLLVKDLVAGDLAVGGTSAVGRGALEGSATVSLPDGTEPDFDRLIDELWSTRA